MSRDSCSHSSTQCICTRQTTDSTLVPNSFLSSLKTQWQQKTSAFHTPGGFESIRQSQLSNNEQDFCFKAGWIHLLKNAWRNLKGNVSKSTDNVGPHWFGLVLPSLWMLLQSSFFLPFSIQLTLQLSWLVLCISERKFVISLKPTINNVHISR